MRETMTNGFFVRHAACAFVFSLFLLQGCAKPHLSENYGRSYEAISYAQVVNPGAPLDSTPVDGCPGLVGEAIYNDYLNTFKGKQKQNSSAEGTGEDSKGQATSASGSKTE